MTPQKCPGGKKTDVAVITLRQVKWVHYRNKVRWWRKLSPRLRSKYCPCCIDIECHNGILCSPITASFPHFPKDSPFRGRWRRVHVPHAGPSRPGRSPLHKVPPAPQDQKVLGGPTPLCFSGQIAYSINCRFITQLVVSWDSSQWTCWRLSKPGYTWACWTECSVSTVMLVAWVLTYSSEYWKRSIHMKCGEFLIWINF